MSGLTSSNYGVRLAWMLWNDRTLTLEDALAQMKDQGILRYQIPTRIITRALRQNVFYSIEYRKALHMAINDEERGERDPWQTVDVILNHRASKRAFRSNGRSRQNARVRTIQERQAEKKMLKEARHI